MINFHKFGFLDAKKLRDYLLDENYWLCRYNPIWLFVWSDLYKPEIAFTNDFCYIRYLMPEIGMCYYPPIGHGNIKEGIEELKQDAYDNGLDFNLGPVEEGMVHKIEQLKIKLLKNENYSSYIYLAEDIAFVKKTNNKEVIKLCKEFESKHKSAYIKKIKKEDFPEILEFINNWNLLSIKDIKDTSFYSKLNMIKKCIDHLYELDLLGIILRDEEKVYGVAIGSFIGNMSCLHVNLALPDVLGAQEELVSCFAKTASTVTRFINLEEDLGVKEVKAAKERYKPFKKESFYANFSL
ncbi:MAG: DUF2156 domain-containing protein [Acholeplasmatales bacterium]|nr:DUF2156 domain-containing protein [Acholeplasmatales bacterium]